MLTILSLLRLFLPRLVEIVVIKRPRIFTLVLRAILELKADHISVFDRGKLIGVLNAGLLRQLLAATQLFVQDQLRAHRLLHPVFAAIAALLLV